jgi:hypothetical protein
MLAALCLRVPRSLLCLCVCKWTNGAICDRGDEWSFLSVIGWEMWICVLIGRFSHIVSVFPCISNSSSYCVRTGYNKTPLCTLWILGNYLTDEVWFVRSIVEHIDQNIKEYIYIYIFIYGEVWFVRSIVEHIYIYQKIKEYIYIYGEVWFVRFIVKQIDQKINEYIYKTSTYVVI